MPARTSKNAASEGQRQLIELKLSDRDIGKALGVSHTTVGRWLHGTKAPLDEYRLKLQELFGIPAESWLHAPNAEKPPEALAAALVATAEARVSADTAAELPDSEEALEGLILQCRQARADNPAPTILARLAATELRAIEVRNRMRGAVELALRAPETEKWLAELFAKFDAHPLLLIEFAREAITPTASRERLADWDRRAAAWREKHAALVEGAEQANAALRAVLPRDPKARWF